MEQYNPKEIEPRWQGYWSKHPELVRAEDESNKPKWYTLVEFPYPSGAGLHVGHTRSYTALDVVSRKLRMQGYNVLYPIGWDAFGLPTENYAIKNKIHPRVATEQNIATFKRQLKSMGLSYDWSREINTTDPKYYKWTQWIFLKLFEKDLAYKKKLQVNWCPSCKIVLANEEVVNDKCERCGTQVIKKEKEQWILAITKYAERLIEDLKTVDYLEKIKTQQINWIGRSEGVQFSMKIKDSEEKIEVYTTRVDTVFGMTYAVVAPEHSIVEKLKSKIENYAEVEKYIITAQGKTDLERAELQKEKTGVELKGIKIINPFTQTEISLFVADYVLGFYGTGAVMAVPAHDERDFEFAIKYNLPIVQSVAYLNLETGADAPRKDKELVRRKATAVIIKHWEKDEILCLDWEKFNWKSFVIGGIEDGETGEQAAIREAKEETGYQDIKSIRKIGGEVHSYFYAAHKDVNRYGESECYYVELGSGEYIEPREEEVKNHKSRWISRKEVDAFINLKNHKVFWDIFVNGEKPYMEDGALVNSGGFSGLSSEEAREKMAVWLEEKGIGQKKVNYKLRDWIFSRQHYWGEPIPIIHCKKCGIVPVPESELPVELPEVDNYEPTDTGESPLAKISDWVNVKCPKCGGNGKRETDTMPNWAGSSWYFLRYIDPDNDQVLADPKKLKQWMPVDLYNGGMEHTTLHLLYSRFWNKFLFDIGVSPVSEPYASRRSHGMVLAEDGKKMSKSLGNVVNPDDVVQEFGADTLRIYEMFMGPFEDAIPWSTSSMVGAKRFLEKVWRMQEKIGESSVVTSAIHKTIKKVGEDIENFRFNTAVSAMMILANEIEKAGKISKENYEAFLKILSPFAPHITEELWSSLGNKKSIFLETWPVYDEKLIQDTEIEMVVQINGKLRDRLRVAADISEDAAKELALASEKIQGHLGGQEIKKIVFVRGKLISIVI